MTTDPVSTLNCTISRVQLLPVHTEVTVSFLDGHEVAVANNFHPSGHRDEQTGCHGGKGFSEKYAVHALTDHSVGDEGGSEGDEPDGSHGKDESSICCQHVVS